MEQKDVFLCHNKADKDWVRKLATALEQETFQGRQIQVFLDEWDIDAGENIVWKLDEGLGKSRILAIIMSPEMIGSDWCKLEVSSRLAADPINRQKKILPLYLRDKHYQTGARIEVPPVLRALNFLDFRHERDFNKQYQRLLAAIRGEPPPRGSGIRSSRTDFSRDTGTWTGSVLSQDRQEADTSPEILVSNLLRVTTPELVWTAPTFLASKREVFEFYKLPAFVVREGNIYSFLDLSDKSGPFADFISEGGQAESFPLNRWRDRPDRWRWAVELLNDSLRRFLWNRGIVYHEKSERFFFRGRGRCSVDIRWGQGDERRVARAPDQGKGNWVHQAARLKFETLGDQAFLSIEPSYLFTVDGKTSVPREESGPLAMKWGGKERNGTIFRHVLMWADAITAGRNSVRIGDGGEAIRIERIPATADVGVGVLGDHVAVGALLDFTEAEKNLSTEPDNSSFEILPEKAEPLAIKEEGRA
ncbi:MAG: toll/interleukin-1 receptor domain-containing protein [Bdellovibrionota bacterium]